jgi:hypothetical protein
MTKPVAVLKFPETAIRRRRLTDEEQVSSLGAREGRPGGRGRDCVGLVTTADTAVESRP